MSAAPETSIVDVVRQAVPGATVDAGDSRDMPSIVVDADHIVEVCTVLRDAPSLQFSLFADMTAVDRLPAEPRFEIVYHLACLGAAYGTAPARRLRVKVLLPGADPAVHTVSGVWVAANWAEREVFDLFGVTFIGHPDLRRVLMPDDWEGHPARKDYNVQIRKDAASWAPMQLTEEQFAANMKAAREHAARAARVIVGQREQGD